MTIERIQDKGESKPISWPQAFRDVSILALIGFVAWLFIAHH